MRRSGEVLVRRRILVSAARAFLVVSVAIGLSVALGGAAGASRTRFHHGNGSDGRNGVEGTVSSAPSSDSFPITTRSGSSLTVDVTSSTIYLERGVTSPSLTNVAEGDVVAVFGTTSGTTVTATQVVISSGQGRGRVGFGRSSRRGHGPEGRSGFGPAGAPGGFGPQQGPR
jgi:hypothetical protein